MIRLGLFLYDHLARRKRLEGSRMVSLRGGALGGPLRENYSTGFTYADCAVDDARLVVANAIAARELGARIHVGTELVATRREADRWIARVESAGGPRKSRRGRSSTPPAPMCRGSRMTSCELLRASTRDW